MCCPTSSIHLPDFRPVAKIATGQEHVLEPALSTVCVHRNFFLFLLCFATSLLANTQSKLGIEHYNYIRQADDAPFVPMLHFETSNSWHMELRYNYEDAKTISLFGGKAIAGGNGFHYSITPMTGFSAGRFAGVSLAVTTEAEWKNLYIWAQSQYSLATKKNTDNFFFNWSELGYNISEHFFAGLAMQYTRQAGQNIMEPGFVAGLNLKNFSFPVYIFSPFDPGCYYVVGLNYEYTLKKKIKHTN